jgi:hypothetical protein
MTVVAGGHSDAVVPLRSERASNVYTFGPCLSYFVYGEGNVYSSSLFVVYSFSW